MNMYGGGSFRESGTPTTPNVCTSEIPFRRRPCTIEALLLPRTSAQPKCTYGEDTLQLKDIEDEKLSLN